MKYYLVKTEPTVYSINKFKEDGTTTWNGVRNPQAVNFLKSMNPNDLVLVYHTEGERTIVGLAQVVGNSRPDPNDSKSWLVDMRYIRAYDPPYISLKQLKEINKFPHFKLITNSRLSVMDVPVDVINYLKDHGLELVP